MPDDNRQRSRFSERVDLLRRLWRKSPPEPSADPMPTRWLPCGAGPKGEAARRQCWNLRMALIATFPAAVRSASANAAQDARTGYR
jgi:hypothetical protein